MTVPIHRRRQERRSKCRTHPRKRRRERRSVDAPTEDDHDWDRYGMAAVLYYYDTPLHDS